MKRRATRRKGERPERPEITTRRLTVTIERIVPGGLGIGHAEGLTILAPMTAAGDVVQVSVDKLRGETVFGSVLELIEAGPERIEPLCPHYGDCGGCDFQHMTYEAQLKAKSEIVVDALRRIGGLDVSEVAIERSPSPWAYRMRAEWISDSTIPLLGYRKRGTRDPFDVTICPVLEPAVEQTRTQLHNAITANEISYAGEVQVAAGDDVVAVAPQLESFPSGLVTRMIGDVRYGFDASGFFQANASILPVFVEYVVAEMVAGEPNVAGEAVDLYCGVGLFTIPIAKHFAHVTGVEANVRAASYAHENAKAAGLTNISISGLDVEQWLRRKGFQIESPVTLLLDPPRTGAGQAVVEAITRLNPIRIVYVSCDPATLARDLKQLTAAGFQLEGIRAFDMFPQTHHVEVVATLAGAAA